MGACFPTNLTCVLSDEKGHVFYSESFPVVETISHIYKWTTYIYNNIIPIKNAGTHLNNNGSAIGNRIPIPQLDNSKYILESTHKKKIMNLYKIYLLLIQMLVQQLCMIMIQDRSKFINECALLNHRHKNKGASYGCHDTIIRGDEHERKSPFKSTN